MNFEFIYHSARNSVFHRLFLGRRGLRFFSFFKQPGPWWGPLHLPSPVWLQFWTLLDFEQLHLEHQGCTTWNLWGSSLCSITQLWWNHQLLLFPSHIPRSPWSQPLMSWPVPREKTNGWFQGRVLSNSVPSSSFPMQCLCRMYLLCYLMRQWSTHFLTLICSFWGGHLSQGTAPLLTTCPSNPPSPQFCLSIPTHPLLQSPDPIWLQTGCPNRELGGPPFTLHSVPSLPVHPHICGCCRGSAPRHPRVSTRWFRGAPVLQGYTPGWPCACSSIAAPTLHPLGPARHPDWSPDGHRLIFICWASFVFLE